MNTNGFADDIGLFQGENFAEVATLCHAKIQNGAAKPTLLSRRIEFLPGFHPLTRHTSGHCSLYIFVFLTEMAQVLDYLRHCLLNKFIPCSEIIRNHSRFTEAAGQ